MGYQVLARSWRPKLFEEVVGQSHIVRSLRNSIQNDTVGHAYLFTGTRGVGKTTLARLFSKAICCLNRSDNGNPCLTCDSCIEVDKGTSIDVLEFDGASNNGVDQVRELISNVQYLPVRGKYKVYIIDEVHMLSTSAFNALLKTLEEPPAHVKFIFATTEVNKLLGTVLSRCQRFDFRNVSTPILASHLERVCKGEGIGFESPAILEQIASMAGGSVRDGLSLLEQALCYTKESFISEGELVHALGLARSSVITKLVERMLSEDVTEVSHIYRSLLCENVEVKNIAVDLLDSLYRFIQNMDNFSYIEDNFHIEKEVWESLSAAELFWIYEVLVKDIEWMLRSIAPEKTMEIVLQKITLRGTFFKKDLGNKVHLSGNSENSSHQGEQLLAGGEQTGDLPEQVVTVSVQMQEKCEQPIENCEQTSAIPEQVPTSLEKPSEKFAEMLAGLEDPAQNVTQVVDSHQQEKEKPEQILEKTEQLSVKAEQPSVKPEQVLEKVEQVIEKPEQPLADGAALLTEIQDSSVVERVTTQDGDGHEKIEAAPENVEKEKPTEPEEKNWDNFLRRLSKKYPASAANIEQGNILKGPLKLDGMIHIELGFPPESKIFYDYLVDANTTKRLVSEISQYFEEEQANVNLVFTLLDEKEREKTGFLSKVEVEDKKRDELTQIKREEFLANQFVKEAQTLFDSKVDKIIVNENKLS
ncbi:MAG: DNA polymerase III subunit gamma/tau [Bacteriovoracaceae bacterium]|jgi:DNA polymerase III subunit gamma/tau|nr:DNA polymerase III subunit gamma/tau [Bacteriovoracaceae bacterium]